MATTLKVSSRSAKKPVKKLPANVEITSTTTVQDVKDKLAKQMGRSMDPNRLGLFDSAGKILKDRKAVVAQQESITAQNEIFVKDLGPQISWLTVFIVEYAGPILIHLSFLLLRPYIYKDAAGLSLSPSQQLAMAMVVLHFVKREYETLFVHRFSLATMPLTNIFKNSAHYWFLSGANLAYWVYSPTAPAARLNGPVTDALNVAGVALYLFGEASNLHTHLTLSRLRSPGGTERGIPMGYGFNLVTCPNYLFESIAWIGVALVTKSWATVLFLVVAYAQMHQWAIGKEKALRREFPDKYKKKSCVIIPTPGVLIKALTG